MNLNSSYQLTINSDPIEIIKVEKLLENIIETYHINEDIAYNLAVSITEAVNNAILHGNKSDNEKLVKLAIEIKDSKMYARIEDEGDGFQPEDIPNPIEPDNIMKPSGRGIFIVKQMMENVEIISSPTGTTVTMEMKI